MKEIMLKADCWSCAKLGVDHGPRSWDCPSGDLHFCKRTGETKPKDVCRFWRPAQKWLDHQLWKAEQDTRRGTTSPQVAGSAPYPCGCKEYSNEKDQARL